jgi:hypothetical protein
VAQGENVNKKSRKDIEIINRWNEKYPEGTRVIVTRDNGDKLETVTRSVAWSMCGTPVVSVKGISGCYALERVAPNTACTGLGLSATKSADTEPEVSPVAATGSQPSR